MPCPAGPQGALSVPPLPPARPWRSSPGLRRASGAPRRCRRRAGSGSASSGGESELRAGLGWDGLGWVLAGLGDCGPAVPAPAEPLPMAALALQRAAAVPRGDGEHRQVGLHGGRGGLALRGAARLRQRPQGLHREQPRRDLPEPRRCRGTGPGLRGGALGTTGGGLGKAPGWKVPLEARPGVTAGPAAGPAASRVWDACVCPVLGQKVWWECVSACRSAVRELAGPVTQTVRSASQKCPSLQRRLATKFTLPINVSRKGFLLLSFSVLTGGFILSNWDCTLVLLM